ncbi:MAG TPA: aminoglycoside phosphotransferase family protein [Candidatus Rothia avicola]|uniref:Aminoglycoside phosphotransferase family protein n=1 Tax=Candidatus Rothia avicola TaxID=2840478 RepID=A0A9D1ZQR7_9MICC|nr:aminoglycoside phosphotransferase family protein [Candidatus Rothia avicola]
MSDQTSPAELSTQRATWADLPRSVQAWVEKELGSPVIGAESQSGGYSLGTADRLVTASGRRAFLKAVDASLHPHTANLHRQEGRITASFPSSTPTPAVLATRDFSGADGAGWVALLLEDIEGRHPESPWQKEELAAVFRALESMSRVPVDPSLSLPTTEADLTEELIFWHKLAQGVTLEHLAYVQATDPYQQLVQLLPFINLKASEFAAFADKHLVAHLTGSSYVHTDLRGDNILIRPTGEAVLIDWPWATVGNTHIDWASVATDALIADPELTLAEVYELMPASGRPALEFLQATVVALAGYYLYASMQKPSNSTNSSLVSMRAHRASALLTRLAQGKK